MKLVGGSKDGAGHGSEAAVSQYEKTKIHKTFAAPVKKLKKEQAAVHSEKPEIDPGSEVEADQVIPMQDGDFKGF